MTLIFVVPLLLAIQTLVNHVDTITRWLHLLATAPIPPPPDWVAGIPLVGAKIAEFWSTTAAAGKEDLAVRAAPYAADVAQKIPADEYTAGLLWPLELRLEGAVQIAKLAGAFDYRAEHWYPGYVPTPQRWVVRVSTW